MSITTKNPVCKDAIKVLGDYWTMMIIDMLSDSPLRFHDLERRIEGVNTATLSTRLRNMQSSKLIKRTELSRSDVTYELTELGKQAVPVLTVIGDFSAYVEKNHRQTK